MWYLLGTRPGAPPGAGAMVWPEPYATRAAAEAAMGGPGRPSGYEWSVVQGDSPKAALRAYVEPLFREQFAPRE
jgi:hypothetical protein